MLNFYCTAGRGTEQFLADELRLISDVSEVSKTDGKVFFTYGSKDGNPKRLLDLKCAERLFIGILHQTNKSVYSNNDVQELGKAIANYESWENAVSLHRKFQEHLDRHGESSGPACKKARIDHENSNVTFRISCKLASSVAKRQHPQSVSKAIGWHLRKTQDWKVETRQPMIEICIHIGFQGVTVGVPVSKKPLSERPYLLDFGLRSTVAWIMGKLANIQPGSVVLDPMCGAGTILIEAENSWFDAHFIGVDLCPKQLERGSQNLQVAMSKGIHSSSIELTRGNSKQLPFMANSIDRVVCDLPFGNKHLTVAQVKELLPDVLTEFNRVLKKDGVVVLLISTDLKEDLLRQVAALTRAGLQTAGDSQNVQEVPEKSPNCSVEPKDQFPDVKENTETTGQKTVERMGVVNTEAAMEQVWTTRSTHYVKLGETHAHICVFVKS